MLKEQKTVLEEGEVTEPRPSEQGGLKGVAKQTGLYGLGAFLTKGLGIIMLPIYTRFLAPADYGVMELIMMALDMAMIVAGAQLVQGIYRFYNKEAYFLDRNRVVSTSFLLVAISFGIVGIATFTWASRLSEVIFQTNQHATLIRIAAVTAALTPTILVPEAYFRMKDRAGLLVASNLIKIVLAAILNVVLLVLGWGITAMFISGLVATLAIGLPLSVRMLREVGVGFSSRVARDLLRYGLPLVAVNVATFIYTFADRFFLQSAGDESVVGLYRFAYQFGFLLLAFGYIPFMQVWGPRRFRIADDPDRDHLYAQGLIYMNLLVVPVAAGIVIFISDFFRIMTTPAYFPAAQYVPIIVTAYILTAWSGIMDIGILIRERTEFLTLANWVAAVVALAGFFLLVPRYLAWGAAFTTLFAFGIRYVLIFTVSQRLWPVRYKWGPVLRILAYSTATAVVGMLLPTMELAVSLAVRGSLFAVLVAALWRSDILSEEDRDAVRQRLANVVRPLGGLAIRPGRVGSQVPPHDRE